GHGQDPQAQGRSSVAAAAELELRAHRRHLRPDHGPRRRRHPPALTGPAERPAPAHSSSAAASLPRLVRTSSEFVVGHIRGIELTRKPAYLADRSRESSTATTPLSPVERMRRPAPWARRRAACVADTAMNPLTPR